MKLREASGVMQYRGPTKKVVHRTPLFVGIRFIDFPSSIRLPKFPYELYPSIRHLPISLGAVYLRPRTHFIKDVELIIPSNKIMNEVILLTAS